MTSRTVGFLGFGYAVPECVEEVLPPAGAPGTSRGGVAETELFTGHLRRRRLAAGETVEALAACAAERALAAAGVASDRIERLYGYCSPSSHLAPNGLYRVHRALGLGRRALVVPVQTEFTNFITAAVLAGEAIAAGCAELALVVCGAGWTRHMDEGPHAAGIGDGAAAAVLGPSGRFVLRDHLAETFSEDEDTMALDLRARRGGGPPVPTFALDDGGVRSFLTNGVTVPPRLALALLDRNRVRPAEVALVTHQASRRLMDAWAEAIRPGEYPSTLEAYGNMTLATVGVTLAACADRIRADFILLLALGLGVHFSALLVERDLRQTGARRT